ncbi:hypothetical protein BH09DEP1_BH09DEP1_6000 [soil metagenome]
MILPRQFILIGLLLSGFSMQASPDSLAGDQTKSDIGLSKQELVFKLNYLKNKKTLYENVSSGAKLGAAIGFCGWVCGLYVIFSQKLCLRDLKFTSKNTRLNGTTFTLCALLYLWLDLEKLPLDYEISKLEADLLALEN